MGFLNLFQIKKKTSKNKWMAKEKDPYAEGNSFSKKNPFKKNLIKFQLGEEDSKLVYHNHKLIRKMDIEKYKIWQELFDKGYQVEPILKVQEIKKWFGKDKHNIIVESKPVGYSFENKKFISFETLIKTNKINILPYQRLSIARQIIKTITGLWQEGYVHGHLHTGNITITFEKGEPKIYLIDFDKITKIPANSDLPMTFGNSLIKDDLYRAQEFMTYLLKGHLNNQTTFEQDQIIKLKKFLEKKMNQSISKIE